MLREYVPSYLLALLTANAETPPLGTGVQFGTPGIETKYTSPNAPPTFTTFAPLRIQSAVLPVPPRAASVAVTVVPTWVRDFVPAGLSVKNLSVTVVPWMTTSNQYQVLSVSVTVCDE